jgi:hypothetical protein
LQYINIVSYYGEGELDLIIQATVLGVLILYELMIGLHLFGLIPNDSLLTWLVYLGRIIKFV